MSQAGKRKLIINVVFLACIVISVLFVFKYLLGWLAPFLVGLVLAFFLQPIINWILRHSRLERKLVAPIITLIVVVSAMFLLVFFTIQGVTQLAGLMSALPGWMSTTAPDMVGSANLRYEDILAALPDVVEEPLREMASEAVRQIQSSVGHLSSTVLSLVASRVTALPSILINFIVTLVATFFICSEYGNIEAFVWRQVPERYREIAGETWITFGKTLGQMLRSYLFIMFITFCELTVSFLLLGIDYAILVAAAISLVDILPILGTGTILIPWGIVAMLMGNVSFGACILGTYVVITIVRNILEPRIIGQRIGLHPLVTLIFMYLGLHMMGLLGMFLLPLMVIMIKKAQDEGMVRLWND